jgi:hypothetical protein
MVFDKLRREGTNRRVLALLNGKHAAGNLKHISCARMEEIGLGLPCCGRLRRRRQSCGNRSSRPDGKQDSSVQQNVGLLHG